MNKITPELDHYTKYISKKYDLRTIVEIIAKYQNLKFNLQIKNEKSWQDSEKEAVKGVVKEKSG